MSKIEPSPDTSDWVDGRVTLNREIRNTKTDAKLRRGWAVHRVPDRLYSEDFRVTHIGTGRAFGDFPSERMAMVAASLYSIAVPEVEGVKKPTRVQELVSAAISRQKRQRRKSA